MDSKRRIQIIVFAVLILAALGIAIPRLVSKPKGERFRVKELSSKADREAGADTKEAQATGQEVSDSASESASSGAAPAEPESEHEIGRNPFRELIRPSIVQPTTAGGSSQSPFGSGSVGTRPLWPDRSASLEPFSPGGLSGFGSLTGDGQQGPPQPEYTLTGIVSGESSVAVLRTADSRMYVRPGDVLDDGSRVASVFRDRVVLNRSDGQVVLVLGGSNNDGSIEQDAGQNWH